MKQLSVVPGDSAYSSTDGLVPVSVLRVMQGWEDSLGHGRGRCDKDLHSSTSVAACPPTLCSFCIRDLPGH